MTPLDRTPGEALRDLRHALALPVGVAAHAVGVGAAELWSIERDLRPPREALHACAVLACTFTPVCRRLSAAEES